VATLSLGYGLVSGLLPAWAWLAAVPAVAFIVPVGGWVRAGSPEPVPLPVLGSNVVHNLGGTDRAEGTRAAASWPWALAFDDAVKTVLA